MFELKFNTINFLLHFDLLFKKEKKIGEEKLLTLYLKT